MKQCPQCLHDNPVEAKFCNNCGSNLQGICPNCGVQNQPQAKFCMECGTKIGQAPASGLPSEKEKKPRRAAERRQLTNLFCDLVGSTTLSEQLEPEEFRQVVLDYHHIAETVIRRYGGHVAQYLGDGLLVYFGYPEGLEDAPKAGVRAGLGILEAVANANKQWAAAGRTAIQIRIGIHTGLVVVDDHLALGKATNIAARLEGLAPPDGLVISPQTLSLVEGWFEVKSLGDQTLKGISQPMEVFQVLRESGARSRLEVAKGKGLSPLTGRDRELRLLAERWEQAKNSEGSLVLLNGEAGIGKSRLVDSIKQQIAKEPDSWLTEAQCSPYHRNTAFYPIIELLETSILEIEPDEPTESRLVKLEGFLLQSGLETETAMPLFAEFLSIPSEKYPPPALSPVARKQRIMDSLTGALLHRAGIQPVLLVMEDLHWADASTLEWLGQFFEQLPGQSIFTLCTTRPAGGNWDQPDWLGRSRVTQLDLHRLKADDITGICLHQTKGKALPREIREKIREKTDGIPLFVEELTKMILESGLLVEKDDRYELAGPLPPLAIPSTLQDSLLARLDRMSPVKEVVQVGSVIGREFSFELLKAVLPRDPGDLQSALDQLMESEMLFRLGTGKHPVYQFKHALIQDAAYNALLRSRRQQLHQQVAGVLERQFAESAQVQPELLAHHYTEAGLLTQAVPLWEKAGNHALQRNANLEGVHHFKKGLELIAALEDQHQRNETELRMLNTLGSAIMMTKVYSDEEAKQVFNRSWELCQVVEAPVEQIKTLMGLFAGQFIGGNHPAAFEIGKKSLELAGKHKDDLFAIMSNNAVGISCCLRGFPEESQTYLEKVLQIYDPEKHDAYSYLSWGHFNVNAGAYTLWNLAILGRPDTARRRSAELFSFIENRENHISYFHAFQWTAMFHFFIKEAEQSQAMIERYLPMAEQYGDPWYITTGYGVLFGAQGYQGNVEALDQFIRISEQIKNMGAIGTMGLFQMSIATCQLRLQDYEKARSTSEKTIALTEKTGERMCIAEFHRMKGEALLGLSNDQVKAEQCFNQALEIARTQGALLWELRAAKSLARLWQQQGKQQPAFELLNGAYQKFEEGFDTEDLREASRLLEKLSKTG